MKRKPNARECAADDAARRAINLRGAAHPDPDWIEPPITGPSDDVTIGRAALAGFLRHERVIDALEVRVWHAEERIRALEGCPPTTSAPVSRPWWRRLRRRG